ncbi:MAG: LamG-like jellyroll fold domain-containing protein, partial [Planctomycetota bacterium]
MRERTTGRIAERSTLYASRSTLHAPRFTCSRGFTLIEMVVVVTILAMLLGLSVVLFKNANKDLGVLSASGHVRARLHSVREFARSEGSPAWVVLDLQDPQSAYPLTRETWGTWHFESGQGTGALGRDAKLGNVKTVQGRVGDAVQMSRGSAIDCGVVPVHDKEQGISIEFWMYMWAGRGKRTICAIGDVFEMRLDESGRPAAKFGKMKIYAPKDMTFPTELWVHVHFIHNGREAQLYLNGVPVASGTGKPKWKKDKSLIFGGKGKSITAIVDELRVGLV